MENQDKLSRKEGLKALRAQRRETIARASATMKAQKKDIEAITRYLAGSGEAIIPDIARETDMPAHKALWYMATLKKYGSIAEGPKEGAFYKYGLVTAMGGDNRENGQGGI